MSLTNLFKRLLPAALAIMLFTMNSSASFPDTPASPAPNNPQLSNFINIWDVDALDNTNMQVVYNPEYNEYLAVWINKQGEFTTDIWGRRIGADGTLYPQFNIYNEAGKVLGEVDAVYNPDRDEYFIVFEYPFSSYDTDLYSRSFHYDGTDFSLLHGIHVMIADTKEPALAYNSTDHEYLVIFTYKNPGGTTKIVGSRVHPDTHDIIADAVEITPAAANTYCHSADVAYNLSRNNFLVSYQYENPITARLYLASRKISPDLSAITLEYQLSGEIEYGPSSIAVGDDEYLVTWGGGSGDYIKARRVRYDGMPLGPAGGFLVSPTGGGTAFFRRDSRVEANFMGYWAVWETFDGTTSDEGDIYGNFIPFGVDQAAYEQFPVDAAVNYQSNPAIACRWQGKCLVTDQFNLNEYPSGDDEIRGRFLSPWQLYMAIILR